MGPFQYFCMGLQFLTRIQIAKHLEWSSESLGKSVAFFPVIGALLGGILTLVYWGISPWISVSMMAVVIVLLNIYLTGGLHCDGLMDTIDGLASGKPREQMLDIMKDSRVGAMGVIGFFSVMAIKLSLLTEISRELMPMAIFLMPIVGRYSMVIGIVFFPSARRDGLGKAFAEYSGKKEWAWATMICILLIVIWGWKGAIVGSIAIVLGLGVMLRVSRKLAGLTGDTYGMVNELVEVGVLFFSYALRWI